MLSPRPKVLRRPDSVPETARQTRLQGLSHCRRVTSSFSLKDRQARPPRPVPTVVIGENFPLDSATWSEAHPTFRTPIIKGPSKMNSESRTARPETPQEHLIQLAASSHTCLPSSTITQLCILSSDTSAVPEVPDCVAIEQTLANTLLLASNMAGSIHSYYSDSDVESTYTDAQSDVESIFEAECLQAQAVRYLQPGRPSIVDLMRAEKPVFKRASQMIVRRPIERSFISPIQPPKNYKRSFSPSASSDSEESSYDKRSGKSSEPSTPILDEEDGSSTPTYDGSPSTPDTPKSSFEQERRFHYRDNSESQNNSFKSKMSSRLRLFPKRSVSMNVDSDHENLKHVPQLPPLFSEPMRSSTNLASTPVDDAPLTARPIPPRSIWRDAGKSKFLSHKLRRVDSRVGLNVH
ncbi:hypothetical protein KVT40_004423 [Elsinoe batatas]|uniref:Uncharacterized protein n=1 Tax=Elsinoe batatas TaxID=2601811 RepID=A0A8K0L439_9PEZI|nr:hypothetical protein KVT40_004423 [Elsinoe batatas]